MVTAITSTLFHTPVAETQFRFGIARAQSTIEDSELYGTLCCVAGCLCLYIGPTGVRRFVWVGFCFFGCLLSISSGPLLVFALVVATYVYDHILKQFSWRWKAYVTTIVGLLAAVFIVAKHPISWVISHLIFDPSSSYFRLYVFDYYFDNIAVYPFKGWGFGPVGDDDFLSQTTVDNVWIVCATRFGLPMIFFLLLTNIGTFFGLCQGPKGRGVIHILIMPARRSRLASPA